MTTAKPGVLSRESTPGFIYNDGPGGLSDGTRAFLLDASALVPEPGSLALLGLAAPVLLRRRPRRTKKSGR